jgi:uncharacterized protein
MAAPVSQVSNSLQQPARLSRCGLIHWRIIMAISKDLLEILVCPVCKATVELTPDGSGLKCVECRRVYPVRDDIPVMLVDEARIED